MKNSSDLPAVIAVPFFLGTVGYSIFCVVATIHFVFKYW